MLWNLMIVDSINVCVWTSLTLAERSVSFLQMANLSLWGPSSSSLCLYYSKLTTACRYRSTSNVKLPLRVIPTVTEMGTTQVTYIVAVKANFNNKLSATSVVLRIPTPLNTTSVDCKVPTGKAKYVPAENVVVWKCVTFGTLKFHFLTFSSEYQECKADKRSLLVLQLTWPVQLIDKYGHDHP